MIRIVLVFFGGGLGSLTRYLLANLIPCDIFPLSILLINALASFILGYSSIQLVDKPLYSLLIITGFCGGLSTFSTFSHDNLLMLKEGRPMLFLLHSICQVGLSLGGVWVGSKLAD